MHFNEARDQEVSVDVRFSSWCRLVYARLGAMYARTQDSAWLPKFSKVRKKKQKQQVWAKLWNLNLCHSLVADIKLNGVRLAHPSWYSLQNRDNQRGTHESCARRSKPPLKLLNKFAPS